MFSATLPRSRSATPSPSSSTAANYLRKLRERSELESSRCQKTEFSVSLCLCGEKLFVVGRRNLQHGEERFLRNVNLADTLHAALAFFLFFEEFAFARDVAAIALGGNVFAPR